MDTSADGQRALERLLTADRVVIEMTTDGKRTRREMPASTRATMSTLLQKSRRDDSPKKYEAVGVVRLEGNTTVDWYILSISDHELELRLSPDSYWRGISRKEFLEIIGSLGVEMR